MGSQRVRAEYSHWLSLLHMLPNTPATAGAVEKFVFLEECEETTTYLCLKTYFVVSLVIYRTLTFSSPSLSSALHSPVFSISPYRPVSLKDPGCVWGALFQSLWFQMILFLLTEVFWLSSSQVFSPEVRKALSSKPLLHTPKAAVHLLPKESKSSDWDQPLPRRISNAVFLAGVFSCYLSWLPPHLLQLSAT